MSFFKIPLLLSVLTFQLTDTSFEPWSFTENDLFPSAIISMATVDWNGETQTAEDKKTDEDPEHEEGETPIFGDENGWLGVVLRDIEEGSNVSVEITIDGFLKPSTWTGVIEDSYEEVRIVPKAKWDFEALRKVREQTPVVVSFKVTVDDEELDEQTENYIIRSINDCPFYVLADQEGAEFTDLSWVFSAYANENHPWIDGILKEALQSELVNSFTGYQSGDPDEVIAQVFAIWNVLQRRGIKYSDISTTVPSKLVFSQSVRFLDDSIDATQANCVDGSVLMASILRKIGIDVHLVMVPGHCFLAFRVTDKPIENIEELFAEGSDLVGLETTMLGNDKLMPIKDLPAMPDKLKQEEFQASFETFKAAIGAANESLRTHADAMISGKVPDAQLISIEHARKFGIMPIASGREKK
ncbi:MAG: hypothetical protein ACK6A8_09545 [Planctomycetota bacterium]